MIAALSTSRRRAALLCAAALLVLSACGGDDRGRQAASAGTGTAAELPASPAPSSPTGEDEADAGAVTAVAVTVSGGEVQGPDDRVEVPLGSTLRFTVTADAADELHVHGYDRRLDLHPGAPATVEFVADIPGVFEVELHESGLPLTSLQVR